MKKIFITSLIALFALGLASPVFAADNGTEVLFENGNGVPLFNEANFVPGHSVTRWVDFKNNTTGTLTAATKAINAIDPGHFGDWLDLVIKEGATVLYNDTLASFFGAGEIMLSDVAGNGAIKRYDFSITMKPETGDGLQGKTLSFDIQVGVGSADAIGGENSSSGGGGGGGGYSFNGLEITQEAGSVVINNNIITIFWLTNHEATSRVVYDNVSHPILGLPVNYGYQWSTSETNTFPMVTGHNVTIDFSDWPAGTYYFRPISHGSPEVYGKELAFVISNADQVTEITPPSEKIGAGTGTEGGVVAGETTAGGIVADEEIFSGSSGVGEKVVAGAETKVGEDVAGEVAGVTADLNFNDKSEGRFWNRFKWLFLILILFIVSILIRYFIWKRKKKKDGGDGPNQPIV